jgi:hypothetical protein
MSRDQLVDPGGVPVVQAGVVDEGELLAAAAVAAQVGRPLDAERGARRERQGCYLGVAVAAGGPLLPVADLRQRLGPQLAVVAAKEAGT